MDFEEDFDEEIEPFIPDDADGQLIITENDD